MEKSKIEAAVASILRSAAPAGGISVHVAGDVHLHLGGLGLDGRQLLKLAAAMRGLRAAPATGGESVKGQDPCR